MFVCRVQDDVTVIAFYYTDGGLFSDDPLQITLNMLLVSVKGWASEYFCLIVSCLYLYYMHRMIFTTVVIYDIDGWIIAC